MKSTKSIITALALTLGLSGCASTQSTGQIDETLRVAERMRDLSERPAAPANLSQVQVKPAAYVGAEVRRNDKGDPLPAKWQREGVRIRKESPASFQEIAGAITKATGIPVALDMGDAGGNLSTAFSAEPRRVTPFDAVLTTAYARDAGGVCRDEQGRFAEADKCSGSVGAVNDFNRAVQEIAAPGAPVASNAAYAVAAPAAYDIGIPGTMKLNWQGPLSGLLDLVAANFNVAWTHEAGQIVFSKNVTRAFDVPALPIVAQLAFDLTSGGEVDEGEGGAISTSGQTASTKGGFDIWSDLQKTMSTIVGGSGTFQISPQTAQIVVVAPPAVVRRVETYLKDVNQTLSKQVAVSVKVFSVAVNDTNSAESDLRVLLRDAGRYGLNLYVPQTLALDSLAAGAGWAVVGSDTTGGSEDLLFRLLSERGDASVVTSASVTSLNGVPVPVQVARTRGYLKSVDTNATAGAVGGVLQSTLTPGSVTTGFNLHLVPRIQRNGDLLMQYGINISELVGAVDGFDVFSTGGQTIQLPNISQRNFIQQANVPNGKTLVLAGFEQVTAANRKRGPVSPALWPLGGSTESSARREIIVIAITPTVLDIHAPVRAAPAPAGIVAAR